MPIPAREFDWAFAQKKQSSIGVPIAGASLDKRLPYNEFSPASMEPTTRNDSAYYGKGHPWATYAELVSELQTFNRTFDATSESLAWALSLLMGDVDTSGPSGGIYTHAITFADTGTQRECLYTSIIEKAGSEYQNILSGAWLDQVTLTGSKTEMIKLALTARARRVAADVTAIPNVTNSIFFATNFAAFTFGASGAETDIASQVTGWNLTLAQNPDVRWTPGATSGEERFVRYALIGKQAISGSISFFLSGALRNKFLNSDYCGLTITCRGILDAAHEMKIEIPKFKISTEGMAQDGETVVWTANFTEETVMKDDSLAKSPITITLKSNIAALLQ